MPVKQREFEKAVTGKGFVVVSNRDHRYFYLKDADGQMTQVRTKISVHGMVKDIPDSMISVMYKQLHFESKNDFMKFVECKKTYEDYLAWLKTKNEI
jgi:uncharacterized protein YlbG (UPF0298 family)